MLKGGWTTLKGSRPCLGGVGPPLKEADLGTRWYVGILSSGQRNERMEFLVGMGSSYLYYPFPVPIAIGCLHDSKSFVT